MIDIEIIKKKDMLTLAEAGVFTGQTEEYLYKMVHFKKIRYYKPTSGRLYFTREDLENWMRQNCVEPVVNEETQDNEEEYKPVNSFYYD